MQSLTSAVQEFENFTNTISDGINKEQVKGVAKEVKDTSSNVLINTCNLFANVGIGIFYGFGVTCFLTLVFPFKLFYKKIFKNSKTEKQVIKL